MGALLSPLLVVMIDGKAVMCLLSSKDAFALVAVAALAVAVVVVIGVIVVSRPLPESAFVIEAECKADGGAIAELALMGI